MGLLHFSRCYFLSAVIHTLLSIRAAAKRGLRHLISLYIRRRPHAPSKLGQVYYASLRYLSAQLASF